MNARQRIVLVEDEDHLAVGISYNLQAEGYDILSLKDGLSAWEHLAAHADDVDLLILDLMLPGMSGYDICESIRRAGHTYPVLILSARTLSEDRTRGFDVGADQYLTKPFELDELLSRVKNLLARHSRSGAGHDFGPHRASFGNVRVNLDTHEVFSQGAAVRLTALEWRLLEYFLRNEGRVVSRSELLQEVWRVPPQLNTRAPDQVIRRLRKTLEVDPAQPRHFLTVRDMGYRFLRDDSGGA